MYFWKFPFLTFYLAFSQGAPVNILIGEWGKMFKWGLTGVLPKVFDRTKWYPQTIGRKFATNIPISNFDKHHFLNYEKLSNNISIVKDRYDNLLLIWHIF